MKRFIVLIIIMILPIMVNAKDITNECKIKVGYYPTKDITDDNFSTFLTKSKNYSITVDAMKILKMFILCIMIMLQKEKFYLIIMKIL